jgi:hypothetical protein
MQMLAQDALKVADHVGWEKFHLMGASMGMALFSSSRFISNMVIILKKQIIYNYK